MLMVVIFLMMLLRFVDYLHKPCLHFEDGTWHRVRKRKKRTAIYTKPFMASNMCYTCYKCENKNKLVIKWAPYFCNTFFIHEIIGIQNSDQVRYSGNKDLQRLALFFSRDCANHRSSHNISTILICLFQTNGLGLALYTSRLKSCLLDKFRKHLSITNVYFAYRDLKRLTHNFVKYVKNKCLADSPCWFPRL